MTFKIKLAVFSNTDEDHKRVYGENYDSSKNYPKYSGQMQIPESELPKFIEYLQKCKPDHNEYLGEPAVPVKVNGWLSESSSGKKYQGLDLSNLFLKNRKKLKKELIKQILKTSSLQRKSKTRSFLFNYRGIETYGCSFM